MDRLPIIIGGFLMITLLFLFVQKTKLGLAIRALQQDQDAAALQGMNIASIRVVVWVVASCLAAVAGVLLSSISYVSPTMGSGYLLKGFAVVIMADWAVFPEPSSEVLCWDLSIPSVRLISGLTVTCSLLLLSCWY